MSQGPQLVLTIPADAKPRAAMDLRALCAPPGALPPRRWRRRGGPAEAPPPRAARAPTPPPIPLPPPPPSPVVQISSAAPPDIVMEYSENAGPPTSRKETLPREEITLAAAAAPAVDPTKQLAEDVQSFVDEESAMADSGPTFEFDEEDIASPLSRRSGYGTLITACLVLLTITAGVLVLVKAPWSNTEQPTTETPGVRIPLGGAKVVKNDPEQPKPEVTPAPPVTPTPASPDGNEPPVKPAPVEPAPTPTPPAPAEDTGPVYPSFGDVGGVVESEEEPFEVGFPGLRAEARVGVEEERPGLIDQIEALRARAVRLERQGQWQEALNLYAQILELKPEDTDAMFRSGTIYLRQNQLDPATTFLQQSLAIEPELTRARNNLGEVYRRKGELPKAIEEFKKAARFNDPDALTNLANIYSTDGRGASAKELYEKALRVRPGHDEARYGLGLVVLAEGDTEAARSYFEALIDRPGVGPRARRMLGRMELAANNLRAALDQFKKAVDGDPKFYSARMDYAIALLRNGSIDAANRQMNLLARERPKDPEVWINRGIVLMASQREADAKLAQQCYQYAIYQLNADTAKAHFNYGKCAEYFQNYLVALEEYEIALKRDSSLWQAAYNLALIYLRGKKFDKALDYFNRALSIKAFAGAHLGRAKALFGLERQDEGKAALRSFLLLANKDDPLRTQVQTQLRQLESSGS